MTELLLDPETFAPRNEEERYRLHLERFRVKLADAERVEGGCLIWRANRPNKNGYAMLSAGRVREYVHRLAWINARGSIDGLHVCHRCDTPLCVEPTHLFLGTQADNTRDMFEKGRGATGGLQRRGLWTHCKNGHPLSGENLYLYPSGRRECWTCKLERRRQWGERRRAT